MKTVNKFLWLCSGANLSIIKRCPTEGSKYAGIGATILFTGLFASLAAGFAIFTVVDNGWYSIGFGIAWGLMIFNLDRYIVSSMKKRNALKPELLMAMPRLLLAVLISIIISKPLEMKIFEKEIEAELVVMAQQVYKTQEDGIKNRFNDQITVLQNEIAQLKNEISSKSEERNRLSEIARKEADGTGGSKKKNLGPIYKVKKKNLDQSELELKELMQNNNALITTKEQQIEVIRGRINDETKLLERDNYGGFAARVDALSRLKDQSSAIKWTDWFIFLLFIALESAPILVKLMSNKGPYDELLEAHEHQYQMRNVHLIANQSHSTKQKNEQLHEEERLFIGNKLSGYLKNEFST